jgi:5-methylcytosine-specific restriction endonuclease McrA
MQSKYHKTENGRIAKKRADHNRRILTKYTEVSLTTKQWAYILKKQNNRCNVCGKRFTAKRPPTQDHIIPVRHNGDYSSDNIQALCSSCNSSKHAKLDKGYIQIWNILIYTLLSIFVH